MVSNYREMEIKWGWSGQFSYFRPDYGNKTGRRKKIKEKLVSFDIKHLVLLFHMKYMRIGKDFILNPGQPASESWRTMILDVGKQPLFLFCAKQSLKMNKNRIYEYNYEYIGSSTRSCGIFCFSSASVAIRSSKLELYDWHMQTII